MINLRSALPALALAAAIMHMSLWAQVASRIEGTVEDASGAVIPGAKLTAVNNKTQARAEVSTGEAGNFVFASLQPGNYTLTVEAGGFRTATVANIELNVAAIVAQTVKMEVGQAAESVTVESNTVSVQTTDSQISRAITMKEIDTLPQLNRGPITLSIFQPGVQIDVRAGQDASFSHVNGLRQGSNNSKLDGIDVNDSVTPRLGLSMTANNTDSVQEFRVVTEGGKAEYGRNAGAQVELLTRTGTNQFHGNAFDYLRNTVLNANDFFNNQSGGAVPKYIRNVYGGSFGGPILKNKTFIFGNFQGNRTRQEQIRNRNVPTPEAIRGIFRYKDASGAVQSYNFAAADPRGLGVDPAVAKLFALYPAPNNCDLGDCLNTAGFRFNNPVPTYEDQFTIRADHHLTSNHVVFLRWSWQRNGGTDNLNNADPTFPGQPAGTQGGHRWGYAIGSDWTLTPTLVNEFRFGHQFASTDFIKARERGPAYITNLFTDILPSTFNQSRSSPVNDITENLTKVLSKHTVKGGANIRLTTQYGINEAGIFPNISTLVSNGNIVPANIGPAGLSSNDRSTFEQLYNDVLGRIDRVTQTFYSDLTTFQPAGSARVRHYSLPESGYFIQDDWKIRRNLMFNIGLRYEVFGSPRETDNFQGTLDRIAQLSPSSQIGDLTIKRNNSWFPTDRNNFAPRAGFSWDIFGDGKTALRGNYGIFYDRAIGSVVNTADGNTPGFAQAVPVFPNIAGADVRLAQGVPATPQPSAPQLQLPGTRSTSIVVINPNLRTGYVQSYALTLQRELFRNAVLEVGYVGNRGVKLYMDEDYNQPRITPEFRQSFLELQAFAANSSAPVSSNNILSRFYGSPTAAVSGIGATNLSRGLVGTVINTLDVSGTGSRYAAAGVNQFYFRNFPQFNQVVYGTNDGRSYYDSLQVSFRRTAGALRLTANYTFSKTIDNLSAEGNGFSAGLNSAPIDSFNLRLNRALADFDRPHSFNSSVIYTVPFGKGKHFGSSIPRWLDTVAGGWEIGSLIIVQSGNPFSVSSQRSTLPVTGVGSTYANYTGTDRSIGSVDRRGDGVYYFTPGQLAQFTYPGAFELGNAGRNVFRNPSFFNVDSSLVKRFRLTEKQSIGFRAEAYNTFNHPNFGLSTGTPNNVNLNTPASFGKFSQTLGTQLGSSSARTVQLSIRYDF